MLNVQNQQQPTEPSIQVTSQTKQPTPKPVEDYHDEQIPGIMAKLVQRIQAEPFNLVGTLIFLGAIIHTFLTSKFMLIAHRLEHQYLAPKELNDGRVA